jgi:hypothetical protein
MRKQATTPTPSNHAMDASLADIAARHLQVDTLSERGADRLDFHDLSVVAIRQALEAAYAAGAGAALRGARA